MIVESDAKYIASQYLEKLESEVGEPLEIVDKETIERSFGWIFFYNSKKYLESGELSYMLAGNAPFIIDRNNGELYETGTAKPIEEYISEYEEQRKTT